MPTTAPAGGPRGGARILFLGDSITYAGQYVDEVEAELRLRLPDRKVEVVNCGLPSETGSGLSEAGHAGGKFPGPTSTSGSTACWLRSSPTRSSPATG